jgi:hypothetical protein
MTASNKMRLLPNATLADLLLFSRLFGEFSESVYGGAGLSGSAESHGVDDA